MYGTTLIARIREHLWDRFQHTQVFIPNDETHAGKSPFFMPYKEREPAFLIFFYAFRRSDDLTAAIFIDTDGHKDRDILYLAAPAALEIDTVYIDIRISAEKQTGTLLFDMLIGFFVAVAYSPG